MGAPISVWVAEEYNRVSGQELTEDGENLHEDLAGVAKERELCARKQFRVRGIAGGRKFRIYCERPLGSQLENGRWREEFEGLRGG